MADVAADIDGEVAADGAGSGGERVGGTEDDWRLSAPGSGGRSEGNIPRPVLTASRPSQTMAQMGPEFMYSMRPAKKPLPARSASVSYEHVVQSIKRKRGTHSASRGAPCRGW